MKKNKNLYKRAIMGACNACEKIEKNRMQDWTFATTDEPTSINPLDTSSRYQNPGNLQAKDLPNPIVNIQNAPNAPEPQGFSALSSILGKSDLFKDMTGLEGNQELLLKSLLSDAQNNRYGQEALRAMMMQSLQNSRLDKTPQFLDGLEEAQKKNLISKEQAEGLAHNWLNSTADLNDMSQAIAAVDARPEDFGLDEEDDKSSDIEYRLKTEMYRLVSTWQIGDNRLDKLLFYGQFKSKAALLKIIKNELKIKFNKSYTIDPLTGNGVVLFGCGNTYSNDIQKFPHRYDINIAYSGDELKVTNYNPNSAYAFTLKGDIYIDYPIWKMTHDILKIEDELGDDFSMQFSPSSVDVTEINKNYYGHFVEVMLGYYNFLDFQNNTVQMSGTRPGVWDFICRVLLHELCHWGNQVIGQHSTSNRQDFGGIEVGEAWEQESFGTILGWEDPNVSPIVYSMYLRPLLGRIPTNERVFSNGVWNQLSWSGKQLRNAIRRKYPNTFFTNNNTEL